MKGLYLLVILVSISGLATIDYKYKLAFFFKRRQTIKVLSVAIAVFIIWDIAGIILDIFFIGSKDLLIGIAIGEFPIEELFFLLLLTYSSLIVYLYIKKIWVKK